jgi:hypothetical protein
MSPADSRALEYSCEALELVVASAETLARGCRDVGLAQDVRRDCGSKRNKLDGRAHRHSDCGRDLAFNHNSEDLRFIRGEYLANQWNGLFIDFSCAHNIVKKMSMNIVAAEGVISKCV